MRDHRKIFFAAGLIWLCAAPGWAQTPTPPATGSIAGQIKLGDKGAPGVAVALTPADQRGPGQAQDPAAAARATTDGEGRFQLNQVAAGRYRVSVLAPGYVVAGTPTVQVTDGQALSGVDFSLTKGGVITGKVTADGNRAVIGEPVTLTPLDDTGQPARQPLQATANFRTDDRGVYRIYGVPAGRYLVSVGRGDAGGGPGGFGGPGSGGGRFNNGARTWQRTYYPEALDAAQATPVEISAGSEVADIDIRMASRAAYAISGRVVDQEGNPVAGVLIGHGRTSSPGNGGRGGGNAGNQTNQGNGNQANQANRGNQTNANRSVVLDDNTDGTTNEKGEFKIEGLLPGKYAVYIAQDRANPTEFYSDPVSAEISSADVSNLEVKLQGASSVSGVVVIDGTPDPTLLTKLSVNAAARGAGAGSVMRTTSAAAAVGPNGAFRVTGLSPGMVNLSVNDQRGPGSGLTLLRIERDGADARNGLRVNSGEQVVGVRLVVAYGSSVVRGFVQVDGGALPPGIRLMAMARRVDNSGGGRGGGGMGGGSMPAQVDAGGRFQIQQLVAGTYEISVQVVGGPGGGFGGPGGRGGGGAMTQTVTVGNNAVQDVVIPVSLATLQTQMQQQQQRAGQRGTNQQPNRPRGGRP